MYKYLVFLSFSFLRATEPAPHTEDVLAYVSEHLVLQGTLRASDGFVYVQVDNDYIKSLVPLLSDLGYVEPDYFGEGKVGAHITVIYPEELKLFGIDAIQEEGEPIAFTIKDCEVVFPRKNFESAYLILVDAPRLDTLRDKYGLGKREYAFHITVGVKPL